MNLQDYTLKITTKTWRKDSHALYDYDTMNFNHQNIETTDSGKLIRAHNDVYFFEYPLGASSHSSTMDKTEEVLANIHYEADDIVIRSGNVGDQELSLALGKGNYNQTIIKQDDVIKLGRLKFKVLKLQLDKDSVSTKHALEGTICDYFKGDTRNNQDPELAKSQNTLQTEISCRICLTGVTDDNEHLISPCKCTGSIGYVHLNCLRQWVSSRLETTKNKNVLTVFWKSLTCELCKTDLPLKLNYNGQEISLISLESEIKEPYLILQSFSKDNQCEGMYILGFEQEKPFKIGRGHECDLRLFDISVSRFHAELSFSKGKVLLTDKKSRFGTLIKRQDEIRLNSKDTKSPWVQIGRTIIQFELNKPWLKVIPWLNNWLCIDRSITMGMTKKEEKWKLETQVEEAEYGEIAMDKLG